VEDESGLPLYQVMPPGGPGPSILSRIAARHFHSPASNGLGPDPS